MAYAKARIAILISGRGSNMVALVDAVTGGRIPGAEVAIVISDQAQAAGLESARQRGIESVVIQRGGRTREDHDREIVAELKRRNVDLVCLAGYMRILSQVFLDSYRGRILNIHPSLLPAFPGLNPQKQALDQGAQTAGCTVHFVDETLDGGPIIAQRRVPILPEDTVESLSARILEQEHLLYTEAVSLVLREAQFSSAAQT
jgi:phosphoribosylglycinamide formyltransferase-1